MVASSLAQSLGVANGTVPWTFPIAPGIFSNMFISGAVKVGIPNCKWCPSALEFSVKYARYMGVQACCSGPFAYTQDSITLEAIFLDVARAELSGTFYEMATKDDDACKMARPNWIDNDLRKMVIAGKVDICILFCWTIGQPLHGSRSGNTGIQEPLVQGNRTMLCVWVSSGASRDSCEYCPRGNQWINPPYWIPPVPPYIQATMEDGVGWVPGGSEFMLPSMTWFQGKQVETFGVGCAGRRAGALIRTRVNSAQLAPTCTHVYTSPRRAWPALIINDRAQSALRGGVLLVDRHRLGLGAE